MDLKNVILDKPFKDDFSFSLSKGEVIIWEDVPKYQQEQDLKKYNNYFAQDYLKRIRDYLIFIVLFWAAVFFFFNPSKGLTPQVVGTIGTAGVISFTLLLTEIHAFFRRKTNIKYTLTSKQIIFQFRKNRAIETHAIPLHQIEYPTMKESFESPNHGNIFLVLKHDYLPDFNTVDFLSGKKHTSPTIIMIDNVKEVFNLKKKTIRKNKKRMQ